MERKVKILLFSVILGLMLTGCMVVPEILQTDTADVTGHAKRSVTSDYEEMAEAADPVETAGSADATGHAGAEGTADPAEEAVGLYAWWSLMYERPNPEKLPVKVRFQWLKGLE